MAHLLYRIIYRWTLGSCVLIHSATLCLLMRAFKVIIDRCIVIEFISKEQWPPSGKKEDKEIRTPRGLPGLNLAQVCILFFSPTSRQLNLLGNRKTKENVSVWHMGIELLKPQKPLNASTQCSQVYSTNRRLWETQLCLQEVTWVLLPPCPFLGI